MVIFDLSDFNVCKIPGPSFLIKIGHDNYVKVTKKRLPFYWVILAMNIHSI
jgi:hypothetical protein